MRGSRALVPGGHAMDDLLHEFLTETIESLETVNRELVRFEKNTGDRAALDNIFRLVHTIKGACGFLNLPRLEALTHAGESLLGQFRDQSISVSPAAVTQILRLIDRVKEVIAGLEARGSEPPGDDRALIAELARIGTGGGEAAKPAQAAAVAGSPPESAIASQSVRVNVAQLERMMTLVSELVLARNQLLQLVRGQDSSDLKVAVQRLSNITSDLQDSVMKTRMQPIGHAWAKLPRLVRDLSLELGKKIELEMTGAETELDRQVLELIRDPMIHMVRNSADHGLETGPERVAAGKNEAGRISLHAYHEGGHIVIEVGDDGRGLSHDRIREKASRLGLHTDAQLAAMAPRELERLIFQPGFSTAERVTSVSGRGVGLDVVRSNVEQIGGTIEVSSQAGQGMQFRIKIPLTLAIVSALIVNVQNERFAIPQIAVAELVRTKPGAEHQIEFIHDAPVLRLRDQLLPLADLGGVLGLTQGGARRLADREAYVVVAHSGSQAFGILVEGVFDTEEIVVKPAASVLRSVPVYSGNTILGDGSVIMIIDPNGIAASVAGAAAHRRQDHSGAGRAAANDDAKTPLLIFRAGNSEPKAVPLSLVTRLEEIDADRVEVSDGRHLVQYRGRLMPVVHVDPQAELKREGRQSLLVFSQGERSAGLAVDEILDITAEELMIDCASTTPGVIGSATIKGRATTIVDVGYHLSRIHPDWLAHIASRGRARGHERLLLVDDSPFFVNLLAPLLGAAGYKVTAVPSADDVLRLKERGESFDVVVSEIEIPGMDGFKLASTIRADGRWQGTRLIALTAHADENARRRGREAGFEDVITKSERERLLSALSSGKPRKGEAA